jgi:hypothetical protein
MLSAKLNHSPEIRNNTLKKMCKMYSGSTSGFSELHESMGFYKKMRSGVIEEIA